MVHVPITNTVHPHAEEVHCLRTSGRTNMSFSMKGRTRTVCDIGRVGQDRIYIYIYTPYMTVHCVLSLPEIPYIHRVYMVLANPRYWCFAMS